MDRRGRTHYREEKWGRGLDIVPYIAMGENWWQHC